MKTGKIIFTLLGGAFFALTACGSSSVDIDKEPDITVTPTPDPNPKKGEAKVFTTTADGFQRLRETSVGVTTQQGMSPQILQIDAAQKFQTMDGFGFALTYSTCYNLLKMSKEDRTKLLKRTYSPTEGYGVSYARISIGCNDFSSKEYTLCDKKGPDGDMLKNFALQDDETRYVIPTLKEVLAINPNLKVIAAPWTCPKWMKVKDLKSHTPYDSWTDGHVDDSYYDTYAQYFVKFVQAMKAEGINIYAVSPQNEPLNPGNCASTVMPWQEEANFVKAMAGAFKQNGLTTQIYVYDHNYDYDNQADQQDYPVKLYNAIGTSFNGAELIAGAAYHDYGGSNTELDDVYNKAPQKSLIFSETSIGTWNKGHNLATRLMEDMKNVALGTVNKHCKAVLVWNLMLDTNRGPNLDGGCQTCYGAIDINPNGYTDLSYNSHYYIICHLSAVVEPGAVRVGTKQSTVNANIIYSLFANPDGTYAAVLLNVGENQQNITLTDGTNYFLVNVPAKSVASCKWNK